MLSARLVRWWRLAFGVLAAGSALLIVRRPPTDRLADLGVYLGAVRQLQVGMPPYDFHAANGDPFTYPPFALLTFYPLGWLPDGVVGVAWTAATLLAMVVLARLVVSHWPDGASLSVSAAVTSRTALTWAGAVALLLSAPGQSNVRFGQVSVFLVVAVLADALGVLPAPYRGVLIGLAAAIKLTPLLFVASHWMAGRRREAAVAAGTFTGATVLAGLVLPQASWTYWTSAMLTTSRIGELAALGNQSVNGMLLRSGVPGQMRPVVWGLVLVVLCGAALWRARAFDRAGLRTHAAVLVGCATVAASPVSWTHHQFWTVLAAMLLIGGTEPMRRVAGVMLLAVMSVGLVDVVARLPVGDHALFLVGNARWLAVVVLCVAGFGELVRGARTSAADRVQGLRHPRLSWVPVTLVSLALFALLPVPGGPDSRWKPVPADEVLAESSGGLPACAAGIGVATSESGCFEAPLWADLPINYSMGQVNGSEKVEGFAAAEVTRLDYVPAPGVRATQIPLTRLKTGQQVFGFWVGDTTYAQLRMFGPGGVYLGDFGGKLRQSSGVYPSIAARLIVVASTLWQD